MELLVPLSSSTLPSQVKNTALTPASQNIGKCMFDISGFHVCFCF